jgi:hypothetical protein
LLLRDSFFSESTSYRGARPYSADPPAPRRATYAARSRFRSVFDREIAGDLTRNGTSSRFSPPM